MDKKDYLKLAIEKKLWMKRAWIIDTYATTETSTLPLKTDTHLYDGKLFTLPDGKRYVFINDDYVQLTGASPDPFIPVFGLKEEITVDASFNIDNLTEGSIKTTYGNVLRNLMLLVYPFGSRISFQEPFDVKYITSYIADRFADDVPDDEKNKDSVYWTDYSKFSEAVGAIRGLAYLFAPSGSEKTMTVSDAVIRRRNELIEQHKDHLNDQVVVAKIIKELSEMDQEWMKGDESEGYFTNTEKQFDKIRMKLYGIVGKESQLTDELTPKTIPYSLEEGIKVEDLPDIINGLRYGSYARGKLTEFGGAVTKLMIQAFKDITITDDDCGSKEGIPTLISKEWNDQLIGLYEAGTNTLLTKEYLESNKGNIISIRTPMLCKTSNGQFCSRCIGVDYSSNRQGLSIAAITMGSIFLNIFMGAMHGKALKTKRFNPDTAIR